MADLSTSAAHTQEMITYQVRIKGHLPPSWSTWFDALTITTLDNGETLISGEKLDQTAVIRLLKKFQNLGLTLVSVIQTPQ